MSPSLRRALHWGGSALAIVGIVFVAFRLQSYWADIKLSDIGPLTWCLIAGAALFYGAANVLLAMAWWCLLGHLGVGTTRLEATRIYGLSQLAKYVPGNIFHLAGRQALGMASGIPGGVLLKSTLWELGLIAAAGALFGWLALPLIVPGLTFAASALLLLASFALVGAALQQMVDRQTAAAFAWQTLFLLASGAIFIGLLYLIADDVRGHVAHGLMIGGAYIVAWLAGLVTPGAPAGVGVRELLLLFLLKGLVTEADLLMTVLIGRCVTVVGDLLFFMAAASIPAALHQTEEKHA